MANANTVRQQVLGTIQLTLAPLPSPVVASTKYNFVLNNNAISQTGGGVIPITAGVTGLYQGTGRVLHIAATGTGVGLATSTLTLELYEVPAAIIAAGGLTQTSQTGFNEIAITSAKAIGAETFSWRFDARLQLDNAGNLEGSFEYAINGLAAAPASATDIVTGLVGEADLNFVLAAEAGTANLTSLSMDEFRIDLE